MRRELIPNASNIETIDIGNLVTSLWGAVFDSCTSLINVIIPDSITIIDADVFYRCTSVTDVYCYPNPENLDWDEDGCDDFKSDGSTICHVKPEYLSAYQSKFNGVVNVTFVGDLT